MSLAFWRTVGGFHRSTSRFGANISAPGTLGKVSPYFPPVLPLFSQGDHVPPHVWAVVDDPSTGTFVLCVIPKSNTTACGQCNEK